MNVRHCQFAAVLLSVVSLTLAASCGPSTQPSERLSIKHVPPGEFFSDPLQVQLALAVDCGDASAVADAVRAGANVNAWGKHGYSLLYWAMVRNNVPGFESLLCNGADVTSDYRDPAAVQDNSRRDFIVRLIIESPNVEFLRAALRQGLAPDYVLDSKSSESLLFLAVRKNNEPALQLLLDSGADIERQNLLGYTPLGAAMLPCDFRIVWFLLQRGANPLAGSERRSDIITLLKTYGSRGVRPEEREYFEKIVAELVRRGLLTREDIVEADKPKQSVLDGPPGITVIEHAPDSEAGRAIRELDQLERDANARGRAERGR